MLTIVFMAVTSAGSAEMMAVSSLVTYDIYKVGPACVRLTATVTQGARDAAPAKEQSCAEGEFIGTGLGSTVC